MLLLSLPVVVPTPEADELRLKWGPNELEEKSTPKWLVYLNMVRMCERGCTPVGGFAATEKGKLLQSCVPNST